MAGTDVARQSDIQKITLENARLMFKNFSGIEGQYNPAGKRNFAIFLDPDVAAEIAQMGYNVKTLRPRIDVEPPEEPQDYLKVNVKYSSNPKARPPRVVLITSRGRTNLDEAQISILDWADFSNVDLIIRPYQYDVNGNTGVSAYLESIYCTIQEDALERKYAEVPDSAQNSISGARATLAIDAPDDTIEAEWEEVD
jgi:hypothetical protein